MNKRVPLLFFPLLLSCLFILHITQAPYDFSPFTCVLLQVSNLLSFAYLSLTSLSSTPLHYEIQLRITPRQIIFILLDSLKCTKIYFYVCIYLLTYTYLFTYLFVYLFIYLLILLLCLLTLNNISAAAVH